MRALHPRTSRVVTVGLAGALSALVFGYGCTLVGSLSEYQDGEVEPPPSVVRPGEGTYDYTGDGLQALRLGDPAGGAGGMGGSGGSGGMPGGGGSGGTGGAMGGGGSGGEPSGFLVDLEQPQGPAMTATVTYLEDGCWEFRIEMSEFRSDLTTMCPTSDGGLQKKRELQTQLWDVPGIGIVENFSDVDCEQGDLVRPGMQPDDSWTHLCGGVNSAVEGDYFSNASYRFVAEETLDVGGETVEVYHLEENRQISGSSEGEMLVSWWFAKSDFRPMKSERTVSVVTDSDFGAISYTEEGDWLSSGLSPAP